MDKKKKESTDEIEYQEVTISTADQESTKDEKLEFKTVSI